MIWGVLYFCDTKEDKKARKTKKCNESTLWDTKIPKNRNRLKFQIYQKALKNGLSHPYALEKLRYF